MLNLAAIKTYALEIARERLAGQVKDVVVEDDLDDDGRPSLRITIILKSRWDSRPPGGPLNEVTLALSDFLAAHGDGRFPYTHYTTAREYTTTG